MRKYYLCALPILLTIGGCSSTITAIKNKPIQPYNAVAPAIYAMTGDRRTAIITDENSKLRYCAESLPDAVAAFSASSSGNINAGPKGGAGAADQATVGLLQTFQRTEIAEISRQLGFTTCLAWLQGAITNEQYHKMLQEIVTGSIDVMKTRASQALVANPPATIQIVPAPVALNNNADNNKNNDNK